MSHTIYERSGENYSIRLERSSSRTTRAVVFKQEESVVTAEHFHHIDSKQLSELSSLLKEAADFMDGSNRSNVLFLKSLEMTTTYQRRFKRDPAVYGEGEDNIFTVQDEPMRIIGITESGDSIEIVVIGEATSVQKTVGVDL